MTRLLTFIVRISKCFFIKFQLRCLRSLSYGSKTKISLCSLHKFAVIQRRLNCFIKIFCVRSIHVKTTITIVHGNFMSIVFSNFLFDLLTPINLFSRLNKGSSDSIPYLKCTMITCSLIDLLSIAFKIIPLSTCTDSNIDDCENKYQYFFI